MAIKKKEIPFTALESSYQKFWQGFNAESQKNEVFCRYFKPHPYGSIRSYQDYAVGEPFHIVVGINFNRKEIRVGAYFTNVDVYDFYFDCIRIRDLIDRKLAWKNIRQKEAHTSMTQRILMKLMDGTRHTK